MTRNRLEWPEALWLVRHAESRGNVADRQARQTGAPVLDLAERDADVALSPTGEGQAEALGRWLAEQPTDRRPTRVLVSPYLRATATAETALRTSTLAVDLWPDERLRERDLGVLDRLTRAGVREQFPDEERRRADLGKFYYRPPGGESWCDVALRLRSLLASMRQEYAGERLLVVTHQAVIMVFRYLLERMSEHEVLDIDAREQIANCAVTRYERAVDGGLALVAFNDTEAVAEHGENVTEEDDAESSVATG